MQILVNGNPREVPEGASLRELLTALELHERPIAVEVNLEVIPRAAQSNVTLAPGDQVEVVTLVGGG